MAEKKYIGKPGKQDDPCWKGYEMVGMKKKNGKTVPNCVPEAREIIEKAKAKLKKDPLTGAKIDKDRFILPEEQDIEEAVQSNNPTYGYHGSVKAKDDADRAKKFSAMHGKVKKMVAPHLQDAKKPNVMVRHFLDSQHGRHIADDPSEHNIKSRFKHFAKKYDPAMHEDVQIYEVSDATIKNARDKAKNWLDSDKRNSAPDDSYRKFQRPRYERQLKKFSSKVKTEEVELEEAVEVRHDRYLRSHGKKASGAGSWMFTHKQYGEASGEDTHTVNHAKSFADAAKSAKQWAKSKGHSAVYVMEELEEAYGMWKVDFPKQHAGKPVAAGSVHVKAQNSAHAHKVAAKRVGVDHKMFKSKVTKSSILPEELGKDNEWGRPELRKKFAAMTPGQEGLAADKIPTFDPRYDDVTTQHLGLHPMREGYLAEISARGAVARAKFQARVHKVLNDPASIKRAKKQVAKQKAAAKEKEAPHLVMQLRKAVSIGSKVHFQDGSHHQIAPNHADQFMSKYNSAKSSIEKEALQKRAHKSHAEFMKTIAEEVHENCGTPDCCMQCDTAAMGTHHVDSYEAHKGSGDQISPVISHDDDDIRFTDFDETEFEKELEADVLALEWEDIVDFYDDDEFEYVEDSEDEDEDEDEGEDMQEAISPAGRLKKKFNAMRTKTRRNMARNLALKRVSTPERVKARSVRAARRMVYKRLLRNRDISSVSAAEKTRIEAQVKRMAPMVARLSVRIMPKVRKLEQSRIQHARARKK